MAHQLSDPLDTAVTTESELGERQPIELFRMNLCHLCYTHGYGSHAAYDSRIAREAHLPDFRF